MIYGKLASVKETNRQNYIKRQICGVRRFHIFQKLYDGRHVFMGHTWDYFHGGIDEYGEFFIWNCSSEFPSGSYSSYLLEDKKNVYLTHKDKDGFHVRMKDYLDVLKLTEVLSF